MKEELLFCLFLAACTFCYGQIGTPDAGQIVGGTNFGFLRSDHIPDSFLKKENRIVQYKDINGTPYINNNQKLIHNIPTGKLYSSDNKFINTFFIRYNAYNDNMELSLIDDGIDYFLLKKKMNAWYILLGKNMYRAYSYTTENKQKIGFFKIISKDNDKYCSILEKELILFKDRTTEQNAFITTSPARFVRGKDMYFIRIGHSINLIPKKKKDFLKLFLLKKELLKKYLDNNKFKLTREEDLIEIINYYNSIYD